VSTLWRKLRLRFAMRPDQRDQNNSTACWRAADKCYSSHEADDQRVGFRGSLKALFGSDLHLSIRLAWIRY
jgi:hypothetical protein